MTFLCQACERRPSLIEERADDPNEPYLVCQECHARLTSHALRPAEWFNLAKRHGWAKFLLHDDFYNDNGEATQPEEAVEDAEHHPAPTLSQVEMTPAVLLDYSVTRWCLDEDVCAAWRRLPQDSVLACIGERFNQTLNQSVRTVTLEVAALLRAQASAFVRHAWAFYPDSGSFWSLAAATAACLPEDEGFPLVTMALGSLPEQMCRKQFGALAHFRSTKSLGWIETHASEPTTEAWGYLAAASKFNWSKGEEWLKAGRPLSLIAIDALLAIANLRTPFLRRIAPVLENQPGEQVFRCAVEALMKADPAPRVMQRAGALLAYVSTLTAFPEGATAPSERKERHQAPSNTFNP